MRSRHVLWWLLYCVAVLNHQEDQDQECQEYHNRHHIEKGSLLLSHGFLCFCFYNPCVHTMTEVKAILFPLFDVGLSLVLCIISVLGYTVYHIQMRKDSAQQARILNHLYSIFAYVSQAQSLTYFANVLFNHLRPEDLFLKCFLIHIRALMSLLVLLTTILLTMGHLLSHHNPSYYLELSVKMETFHKWIMFILLFAFSASLVFLIPNVNENKSACKPLKAIAKPLGIAIAICLFLLTSLLYQTRQLWIRFLSRGLFLLHWHWID